MDRSCLIVDDSRAFLASAAALLASQGMRVVGCAASAAEALRMADELEPQLVLVDVDLGDDDGVVLARQLARRRPGIVIVLSSAHELGDVPELIVGSGTVGFLSKTALSAEALEELVG
jgi:two-component system, NarL family, nitrate/nitrite response regulator NarL